MSELLKGLNSQNVKSKLQPIETNGSYEEEIFRDLSSCLISQPEACRVVARQVSTFEAGLNDPRRPACVNYFMGPTGVGKSETPRVLAKHLFGDSDSPQIKFIDCAEYADSHSIYRLVGAPPGYVGYGDEGVITSQWLNNRNVLVFDEIEKAHPQMWRLLLSVMENGRLKSRESANNWYHAKEVDLDFTRSFIFLTSNVGAQEIEKARRGQNTIGFRPQNQNLNLTQVGREQLKKYFAGMPEFVNRLDSVVVFNPLKDEAYNDIYWVFIEELNRERAKREPNSPYITTTLEFKDHVLGMIDKSQGARELRRTIVSELLGKIADIYHAHDLRGHPIVADYEDDKVTFYTDDLDGKKGEVSS